MAICGFPFTVQGRLIPCGKCQGCLRRHRRAWVGRMLAESTQHEESSFVTLTYADEHLPLARDEVTDLWIPTLVKSHPQKFVRAVRKKGYAHRYFAAGEYGEKTSRPHYHLIMFGLGPGYVDLFRDVWGKGHVSAYEANPRTMAYVAKYCLKGSADPEPKHSSEPFVPLTPEQRITVEPFRLTSRRPAIGATFARNIGASLRTRRGIHVLHDPSVHVTKQIRLAQNKYPLDQTMRKHITAYLVDEGMHPEQVAAIFNQQELERDEEAEKSQRQEHFRAKARGIHKRSKL